ncbi:TPA: hypothetical protein SOK46_002020 [Clostridioides difficile]|nr:hypothetical protein [Clostridioides difficile]HEK4596677.1 hypothetical protein [Clostridioides difficile]HEK4612136.1 hypothetical protein [Clostridioides difficile]HEK4616055.1 hypothetical protein [Clostridioides difficile]HEK4646712.1 hypothetical protein [Clostridioides difficile]
MSIKVAYGGVLLALNVILLTLTNIIPVNTLFIMGLASLLVSIVIMEWGFKSGIAFYIGSIVLGFIVMTSKSQWIVYSLTFGIYGIVKYLIEKDRSIYIEYFMKLVFANIMILILYFLLRTIVYIPINIFIIGSFEIAFIVYDYVYSSFIGYYNNRLRKMLFKK